MLAQGTRFRAPSSHSAGGSRRTVHNAGTAAAAAAVVSKLSSRPLHHVAPDGFSSAWVLPNVPQHYRQLREALAAMQKQLDRLMAGSCADRVEGALAAAGLCVVIHRAWSKQAAGADPQGQGQAHMLDKGLQWAGHNGVTSPQSIKASADVAATNVSRAQRFISRATEQAAQVLLSAANGNNTLPDISWDALPATVREPLLKLFQQQGWVSNLGLPVMNQQLPYERPMDVDTYHNFISNNPHYCAYWEEDYWVDFITPTPAPNPWVHVLQMQQVLTEKAVLNMSAHVPAFQAVLEAAVAARILPEQLLVQAQEAAAKAPVSTAEIFMRHWMRQASAAIAAFAPALLSARSPAPLKLRPSSSIQSSVQLLRSKEAVGAGDSFTEDRGDGSGGSCYGCLTAVGSGDEGDRSAASLHMVPVADAQQQADLPGGAEGLLDPEQHLEFSSLSAREALGIMYWAAQQVVELEVTQHRQQQLSQQPDLWAAATALQLPRPAGDLGAGMRPAVGPAAITPANKPDTQQAAGQSSISIQARSVKRGLRQARVSGKGNRAGLLQGLRAAAAQALKALQ